MSLTPAQYKKYHSHPLLVLFRNLANGPDGVQSINSKAALRRAIEETLPDELGEDFSDYRQKLYERGLEVVKAGTSHEDRFELRGSVEQKIADFLDAIDLKDHIVAPAEDIGDEVIDEVMRATDGYSDVVGGDLARAEAEAEA